MRMIPIRVRPMQHSDLDFAAACTATEGWISETRQVFEGFYAHDPNGCFIAEIDGRPIGICIATRYGESGFIGELIVLPEMRERGVGSQLLAHAVETLHHRGVQNIFLDGVRAAVPLYERAGFRKVCRSLRFMRPEPVATRPPHPHVWAMQCSFVGAGLRTRPPYPHVRAMQARDLNAVREMDRQAFAADRSFFLERRFSLHPELCQVLEFDGEIGGYIMGRRGNGIVSAGPWVIQPGVARPGDLLESLAVQAGDAGLSVGVLETNAEAVHTIRALGFQERPNPPWRMALGPSAHLGASAMCYAIGSPAKG
jgi:GNAT superfamily N-acetyltransferase